MIPEYKGNPNIKFQEFPQDKSAFKILLKATKAHRKKPVPDKRHDIVKSALNTEATERIRLNKKAQIAGFVVVDVHTHEWEEFLIIYTRESKSMASRLFQKLRGKGFNVHLSDAYGRDFGKELVIELSGTKEDVNILEPEHKLLLDFIKPYDADALGVMKYSLNEDQFRISRTLLKKIFDILLSLPENS